MGNDITVAILNSSVDTIEMLKTRLQQRGFPFVVGGARLRLPDRRR